VWSFLRYPSHHPLPKGHITMRSRSVAIRFRRMVVSLPVALALFAATGEAQGTISGRLTAKETGQILSESRVLVVGTSLVGLTGADGRYTIRNVPAGTWDVHALRVGYEEAKQSVTVANGQTATADFALARAIVKLAEVVTTATGEQRRVE